MKTVLLAVQIAAFTFLMLALSAPVRGQSLGELGAAQGIHGTLARGGMSSARGTRDTVKRSVDKSAAKMDIRERLAKAGERSKKSSSGSSGKKSGGGFGSSGGSRGGGGARGSWVAASSTSRGSGSSAWVQGGASGGRQAVRRKNRS